MSEAAASTSRLQVALGRLDAWAERDVVRRTLIKSFVTVAAPMVIVAGVAMLVLPGPGLVTIAAGFSLLAVGYPWARRVLARVGLLLSQTRQLLLPKDASPTRRVVATALVVGFFVSTTAATTAATAWLGAQAIL